MFSVVKQHKDKSQICQSCLSCLLGIVFTLIIGCQSQEPYKGSNKPANQNPNPYPNHISYPNDNPNPNPNTNQNSNLKKMTLILDWYPSPNHVPIYAGLEKGIFAKHGIDLIVKKPHDFPEIPSLIISGQADFALYTMPHTIISATRGNELTVAAVLINSPTNGLYHLKNGAECSLKDYNGMTFASTYHFLSRASGPIIEKSYDIQFQEKQKLRCDVLTTLVTGRANLVSGALHNIERENWRCQGVDICFHPFEDLGIPSYCELVFLAHRKSEIENRSFREAIAESISYCRNHPDEAFSCYVQHQSQKSKKTIAWEKEAWRTTLPLLADQQTLDRNQWETFYSWMQSEKLINQNIDLDKLITY